MVLSANSGYRKALRTGAIASARPIANGTSPESGQSGASTVPFNSQVFGYGPMLPFAFGAIAVCFWPVLHSLAIALTIIWSSLIIAFLGGVRRGFGFGSSTASTKVEIITMMLYVSLGGIALILRDFGLDEQAVAVLLLGYILVMPLDYSAARAGDAPAHFAVLRPPQIMIAIISLAAILISFHATR